MTDLERRAKLEELLKLPNENEWVEFKTADAQFGFDKLGKYFSALSNEANLHGQAAGWLVLGVNKQQNIVGTDFKKGRGALEKLKHAISTHTALNLTFRHIHEVQHSSGRVLMFEIPPTPHGVPMSWQGHFYGRDGESLGALNQAEHDAIRAQSAPDWSAEIVKEAMLADLDPDALSQARKNFKKKNPKLASEVDGWDETTFLNKAKVARNGKVTRTALLLLGRIEASHWLTPADPQMTWVLLGADRVNVDYQHFGPPFLLNTEELYKRVRNITYRIMPDGALFPIDVLKYEPWVIRELLHNCIAHQDYELRGRVNVVENEDSLTFKNLGIFIPQSVERVIEADCPPDRYRNPFLAEAMVQLDMIDTIGSGIRRVFRKQRDRGFPMPDYDLSEAGKVEVLILGKVIDENYTRTLLSETDLDLYDAIALDKIQKRRAPTDAELKSLKKKKLIEGRKPNFYVSARVASATGREVEYVLNSGIEDSHYKELVLKLVREFKSATPGQISKMLLAKLPSILNEKKKKEKLRNLVQEMSRAGLIKNVGKRGRGAIWTLAD